MKRLCGVNPPVITIFDEHHKVDIEASKRQADFLISKGVDGLAYLGTSGEFSIMTVEEKKNFINEMIKYVNGRVNVIVGVGDTCLENTMDLLKFVEQAGADGVLLINPYFSVYSTDILWICCFSYFAADHYLQLPGSYRILLQCRCCSQNCKSKPERSRNQRYDCRFQSCTQHAESKRNQSGLFCIFSI